MTRAEIIDQLWNIPNSITADKMYKPRPLMTRDQAIKMLAVAADYPKGTVPEEFLEEARKVMDGAL